MENNRTAKAIKNVKISILTYIVIIILQFANRSIFVGLLSDEYLGLNGLFSNVLQFLALAELGIGSAMSYALYRPLNDNNVPLLKSYMKFYQKAYFIIGIVVLVMGLALTPFLSFFIKDMPENHAAASGLLYFVCSEFSGLLFLYLQANHSGVRSEAVYFFHHNQCKDNPDSSAPDRCVADYT